MIIINHDNTVVEVPNIILPTPNLPTKRIPTKTARLKLSGKFPTDLGIPPLKITTLPESKPPKSRILVRRLAVSTAGKPCDASIERYHVGEILYVHIYIYIYICTHTYIHIH